MIALVVLMFVCSACAPSVELGGDASPFYVRGSEQSSRESTIRISAYVGEKRYKGTGFYFLYKGVPVILTAAHVVENAETVFVTRGEDMVIAKISYLDSRSDLAILSVPNLSDWNPTRYVLSGKKSDIGEECYYSGYPNDKAMMTLAGKVAGYTESGNLILDSYAWSGASGSAVFNKRGKIIGVVSAIDVGTDYLGHPTIIQNVVMVVPVAKLNYNVLDNALLGG